MNFPVQLLGLGAMSLDSSGGSGQFWNLEFYVGKAENLGFIMALGTGVPPNWGPGPPLTE